VTGFRLFLVMAASHALIVGAVWLAARHYYDPPR